MHQRRGVPARYDILTLPLQRDGTSARPLAYFSHLCYHTLKSIVTCATIKSKTPTVRGREQGYNYKRK